MRIKMVTTRGPGTLKETMHASVKEAKEAGDKYVAEFPDCVVSISVVSALGKRETKRLWSYSKPTGWIEWNKKK